MLWITFDASEDYDVSGFPLSHLENLTVLDYRWYNSPLSDHTSLLNSAIL